MGSYLDLYMKRDLSSPRTPFIVQVASSRSRSAIVQITYPLPCLPNHTLLSLSSRLVRRIACGARDDACKKEPLFS